MIKYYEPDYSSSGCPGQDELTENGINQLLGDEVTRASQINGTVRNRKFWAESDEDKTVYQFIDCAKSIMNYSIFKSASDDDCEGDLTGNEKKYSSYVVLSNTIDTATFQGRDGIVFEATDKIYYANGFYNIDTLTDNGDDTFTINFTSNVGDDDWSNTIIANCLATTFVDLESQSFWLKMEWVSGVTQNVSANDKITLRAE